MLHVFGKMEGNSATIVYANRYVEACFKEWHK